jgi:ABC-type protease/lipase transport system fused ATPase/permease subunit
VIAHRLSTIREAEQILVIDEGQTRECGTHDELPTAFTPSWTTRSSPVTPVSHRVTGTESEQPRKVNGAATSCPPPR